MLWKRSRKNGSGSREAYQKGKEASKGVTTSKVSQGGLEMRVGDSSELSRRARELEHLRLCIPQASVSSTYGTEDINSQVLQGHLGG